MAKIGKLKFDRDDGCYSGNHKLGRCAVEVIIDVSEESIELDELVAVAQSVSDDWQRYHQRLANHVAEELASCGCVNDASEIGQNDCIPFYLRVYAAPDGEISYAVSFNVPSVLDGDDEYVDVEEEINGEWVNSEVCSTE